MIIINRNNSENIEINKLAKIVIKQMEFIGVKNNLEPTGNAIKNALKNDRAIFFIKLNENRDYVGFAFGNIGSGLETGSDYLWINELFVEPEYRRKKIATEFFCFIEKWARDNEIKYIAAMTSKKNKSAINFYKNAEYGLSDVKWIDKHILRGKNA
jgi:GNAT superfamily N-acetyltransferase